MKNCLKTVQKPARYIGNEFNSVHKVFSGNLRDDPDGLMSFAFCFPDVYEVGMSHLGMKILYHMLNEREDTVCERVFAPWDDMEQKMRENGIPLLSMESRIPVRDFDMIGFTLQYEMSYSNIVNMLELAGSSAQDMRARRGRSVRLLRRTMRVSCGAAFKPRGLLHPRRGRGSEQRDNGRVQELEISGRKKARGIP